jgi:indole-3-acetate monooxygenase
MLDAGLFRLLTPASLGGFEANLATFVQVIEEIAKADGSAAWCLAQGAGSTPVAASMHPDGAKEVFGDPRTIAAWGPGTGVAVPVDGGYRLTGQWAFASGCHHSTWLGGIGKVVDRDGSPRLRPDGTPETIRLLFPVSEAKFTDVWHVSGLRGTGSDNFAVEDLFVRDTLTFGCSPSGRPLLELRREPGVLYAFPLVSVYSIGFGSVALGIARGALDAFVDLAGAKTPALLSRTLRDDAVVQFQVGHAEADLRAARVFLLDTIRAAWATAEDTSPISLEHRVNVRLATTYAMHQAADVVDAVYRAAGATAVFENQPFERRLRDVLAVTQQIQGRQTHFTTVGQYLLGLDPDPTSI